MNILKIEGCRRVAGEAQGYRGLPIRDEVMTCGVGGPGVPVMVTAWEPNDIEVAQLEQGAPLIVRIQGTVPAPISIEVGDRPTDARLYAGGVSRIDDARVETIAQTLAAVGLLVSKGVIVAILNAAGFEPAERPRMPGPNGGVCCQAMFDETCAGYGAAGGVLCFDCPNRPSRGGVG